MKYYYLAVDVNNKRNKAAVLKWTEDGAPKQLEIAPSARSQVEIEFKQNFYPNPTSFSAVEKDSGKTIKINGRNDLLLIPRTKRIVERIDLGMLFLKLTQYYLHNISIQSLSNN